MFLVALLLACTPKTLEQPAAPEPEAPAARPAFAAPVQTPVDGMPGVKAHVDKITIDGIEHPLALRVVAAAGQKMGDAVFAETVDAAGAPIPWPATRDPKPDGPRVCNVIDFTSLLHNDHGWFHLAHLECILGGVVVTPMTFAEDGSFTPGTPKNVDFGAVGGTTTACAGDITPWNTHLGSEEYEANARWALEDGTLPPEQMDMATKHPYEWSFLNEMLAYRPTVSPYLYGWIPEIRVTAPDGTARVDKHYTLGRFSHELALVMPDKRTVYLTDDQYNGGFYLFVADRAAVLNSGTLYAAKWNQTSDTAAELEWVSLGHASDKDLEGALEKNPKFSDLLEVAELGEDNTCPDGFGRSTHAWGTECLKLIDPILAGRLETRRVAGLLGATTEFTKSEGLAFDPGDGPESSVLYMASSKITAGMLEEQTTARGPGDYRRTEATDHIRLPANRCGVVWGIRPGKSVDSEGTPIDSPYVMRAVEMAVAGVPEGETACSEAGISNPDNLTFAEDYGWLLIAEDTISHAHDTLWAVDMRSDDRTPVPLVRVDPASEVTGIHWFNVEGKGYLTLSNQWDPGVYPQTRSAAALLGPFPLP